MLKGKALIIAAVALVLAAPAASDATSKRYLPMADAALVAKTYARTGNLGWDPSGKFSDEDCVAVGSLLVRCSGRWVANDGKWHGRRVELRKLGPYTAEFRMWIDKTPLRPTISRQWGIAGWNKC